ncbi:hypothetical protein GCM10010307_34620 [Streptomyces vastus]|uniref:Phosphate ABC transporter substrate-binding protein n=1 Tax=Streptomyces vastus TaxID=285451 RepID=A0ABP6D932_9ACTN
MQMDNPIGHDVRSGRANVRLGLFDEAPDMSDATLVLLRVENDGSQSIADSDYTGRERHGLTAVFSDRVIRGVSVTQPAGTDHLMDHFTPAAGFGYQDGVLRIPRVPLNRGEHFKMLVLLSGGDVGCGIRLIGGIRDGEVHPNRSATPDDQPPLFSRAARLITVLLTLCVIALATIIVARDDTPPPIECETGELTLTGSTAFKPVLVPSTSLDCRSKDDASSPVTRCELDSTQQVLDTLAEIPGSIGYSELSQATERRGLRRLAIDGHQSSVENLEKGGTAYPYYGLEYAYTYRRPSASSLADSFLAYVRRGTGQSVIRGHGHVPCETVTGGKLCDEKARSDEAG